MLTGYEVSSVQTMKLLSSGIFAISNGVFLIQSCKYFQFKSKPKSWGTDALSEIRKSIKHNFTVSPKHCSRRTGATTLPKGKDIRSKEHGQGEI